MPPQSPVNRSLMLRTEQNDRMNRMPAGVYYHECIICQLKLTKFCGLSFAGRQLGPRPIYFRGDADTAASGHLSRLGSST